MAVNMGLYEDIIHGLQTVVSKKFEGKPYRLAKLLGERKVSYVQKILKGERQKNLQLFCRLLEAAGAKITFEEADASREVHFVNPKIVNAEEIDGPVDDDYLAVPLASMPVAAGPGIIPEEDIQSWVLVWRNHESVRHRSNLVAVEIGKNQHSMEPTLHPKDIVLIDRSDFIPKEPPGNIYLIREPAPDCALAIKRVRIQVKDGQEFIVFYSDNPQYPPDFYNLKIDYDNDIKKAVIGRVVWAWSDMSKK